MFPVFEAFLKKLKLPWFSKAFNSKYLQFDPLAHIRILPFRQAFVASSCFWIAPKEFSLYSTVNLLYAFCIKNPNKLQCSLLRRSFHLSSKSRKRQILEQRYFLWKSVTHYFSRYISNSIKQREPSWPPALSGQSFAPVRAYCIETRIYAAHRCSWFTFLKVLVSGLFDDLKSLPPWNSSYEHLARTVQATLIPFAFKPSDCKLSNADARLWFNNNLRLSSHSFFRSCHKRHQCDWQKRPWHSYFIRHHAAGQENSLACFIWNTILAKSQARVLKPLTRSTAQELFLLYLITLPLHCFKSVTYMASFWGVIPFTSANNMMSGWSWYSSSHFNWKLQWPLG